MNSSNSMEPDSLIQLVVEDAKNEGFGPTKHTTYRIACTHPSSGVTSQARHRFSSFLTLRMQLLELLPGVVVPPLPEKQVTNRFATEFIEKRRDMLELFLQRIADHPLAANCDKVHAFCMWPEQIRTSVASRCMAFRLPAVPPPEQGDPLRDAGKMLTDFEAQLTKIRETFKRLQHRQNDDGMDLNELAQGIRETADNPMNSVISVAFNPFAEGLQALAKHTKAQAVGTKHTLLQKLKIHRALALAIIEQFKGREKVQKEIDQLNTKVKELLAQSTKLAGKPGKEKQAGELEHKAADMQQRITELKEKYQLFTQTLVWEHERYNRSKNKELLASLQAFAINYVEYTQRQHELYGGLSAQMMQNIAQIQAGEESGESSPSGMPLPAVPPSPNSWASAQAAVGAAPSSPVAPPPVAPPQAGGQLPGSSPFAAPNSPFGAASEPVGNPFAAAGASDAGSGAPPGGGSLFASFSASGAPPPEAPANVE